MTKGNGPLDPGNGAWEWLAEATLDIHVEAFGVKDNAETIARSAAALEVWEALTRLDLAVPPPWVVAVWHAKDGYGKVMGPELAHG